MRRRDLLRTLLTAPLLSRGGAAAAPRRPNIVFICTDDQAYWSLGCEGNRDAKTPVIDRLRSQGAHVANSFVAAPVCSPSRATTFSGRYGSEVGITDVINPAKDPDLGLPDGMMTWPKVLSDAGYFTGLIGKWHLGTAARHHPTKRGFRYFAGFPSSGETSIDPDVEIDGKVRRIPGFTSEVLTDLAIDFVRAHKSGPFLLNLHFWAPHANQRQSTPDGDRTWLPVQDQVWRSFQNLNPAIPNPDYPHLDIARVRRMTTEYLASVASVDVALKRLLGVLDELNLAGNTVVIFTSDNGFNIGHHGIWHKGNGWWILTTNRDGNRNNLYDNSLHVPCIIRWPGVIKPGSTVRQTVSTVDWYPTILSMAGLTKPASAVLRGRDFTPLLRGESRSWNNDLYAEYSTRRYGKADLRMYRTPEWKLIRDFFNPGSDELYHLATDPAEAANLIGSSDEQIRRIRDELDTKLLKKMREVGDPLARDRT
jgi:choline-sulfatase